jgi:hypothetical protein
MNATANKRQYHAADEMVVSSTCHTVNQHLFEALPLLAAYLVSVVIQKIHLESIFGKI